MLLLETQETVCCRELTKMWRNKSGGGRIFIDVAEHRGRHQRSNNTVLCHLLWPLVLSPWEGVFPYDFFHIISINSYPKLTYLLSISFDFLVADPPQSCLWKPLKVCYKRHWSDLPIFILFSWLQWIDFKNWFLKTNHEPFPGFRTPLF